MVSGELHIWEEANASGLVNIEHDYSRHLTILLTRFLTKAFSPFLVLMMPSPANDMNMAMSDGFSHRGRIFESAGGKYDFELFVLKDGSPETCQREVVDLIKRWKPNAFFFSTVRE